MSVRQPAGKVPQLLVERLALGELAPERAREVEARLASEPGGVERLAAIRRDNAETLLSQPPRQVVPKILARAGLRPARPARRWLLALSPLVAGAAAFAVWARPPAADAPPADPAAAGPEAILLKGATHLCIHRKSGPDAEKLEPGAGVHPRDLLQVAYFATTDAAYGVILSVDGRSGVTLHFPERTGQSQALTRGNETALAHAYELDDAPGFERFFFVTSDAPIDVDAVLVQARALAARPDDASGRYLDLPAGLHQTSLTLRKEP